MEQRMTRSMGLLAILIACGVAGAEAPLTANLTVTPSPTVRRGETLRFRATLYHNPDFLKRHSLSEGAVVRVWVARHDLSWISGKLDVRYPAPNNQAALGFVTGFAVPADATGGQTYDFVLVTTGWQTISGTASTKVMKSLSPGFPRPKATLQK
jgi:hypothetical protein